MVRRAIQKQHGLAVGPWQRFDGVTGAIPRQQHHAIATTGADLGSASECRAKGLLSVRFSGAVRQRPQPRGVRCKREDV